LISFLKFRSKIDYTIFEIGGSSIWIKNTNGEDDHVHLLVSYPPKLAISNLVGKLKGKSTYFLRKEYWNPIKNKLWGKHLWSPSYCAVSCGEASLDIIKQYIQNQQKPTCQKNVKKSITLTGRKRTRLTRP
jgi:putative transposase